MLALLSPVSCTPQGEPRWSDFSQPPRQPGQASSPLTSNPPTTDPATGQDPASANPAVAGVDPRVQNFVARFPGDDRQPRPAPSQSSNPPTAQQPVADPATPKPSPAPSAPPAPAANRPVVQAMRPVEPPPVHTEVQASPQPIKDNLLTPAPEPLQPRVELIDIRPAAAAAVPASPADGAPPANQPVQNLPTGRASDLGAVVAGLEESVKAHPEHLDDQFRLRLLYLATGQDEKAVGPVVAADPVQAGLATALFQVVTTAKTAIRQPTSSPAPALAAVDELRRLLGQQSPVIIPKVALVTRVNSFGDYEAVNPPKFPAGRGVHVYLYTEVANFRSEPTPDGRLRTLLAEKVEVFNAAGKIIWQQAADTIEDKVLTPRRDFFVPLEIRLPTETPAGEYTLKVTIEDKLGATTDQQRMTLTIE